MTCLKSDYKFWLEREVDQFFPETKIQAWLFGSVLDDTPHCNDVDMLIKYEIDDINEILKYKGNIEKAFEEKYNLKLHVICLSLSEFASQRTFINNNFKLYQVI